LFPPVVVEAGSQRGAVMTAALPLVSVIVPVYRAERFLEDTIQSVLSQTYDAWELLLVDDAGGDASASIAAAHAARDPERITLLAHPNGENRGASASRNLAIGRARGTYIALLDADDVWQPTKLEEQVQLMESHPDVGMLYGNSVYWYGWTGVAADALRDRVPDLGVGRDTVFDPPALLTACLRGTVAVPCPCSVMLRRDAVQRAGGFENGFVGPNASSEDLAFFAKVMLSAKVLVSSNIWDRYRRHPDSVYERAKAEGIAVPARLFYFHWLDDYLARNRITDADLSAALRSAIDDATHGPQHGLGARLRRAAGRVVSRLRSASDDRS
jgi:glycosyltransferase involved in cell wall biosynthesis